MLAIQILLITASVTMFAFLLARRGTHRTNAWKKLFLFGLMLLMIGAVLYPNTVTWVANLLGIGRGADLLLYVMFAAFLFYVISRYVKDQDERDKLYQLARQVAIVNAKNKYKVK